MKRILGIGSVLHGLLALGMLDAAAQERGNLLEAPERIEWDAGGLYAGRLSDGTPVQVALAYPEPDRLQEHAKGIMRSTYWYPRRYTGSALALSQEQGQDGSVRLAPVLASGAQAQGRFVLTFGARNLDASGSWTPAPGGKPLSMSLERVVLYRAVALTLPSPQAQAEGSDRQFSFSALFPVMQDENVNAWIRARAGDCKGAIECSNRVEVGWYSNDLLSLQASNWSYGLGAAHGNLGATTRHYALAGGAPVHTRFTAFVAARGECRDRVSNALVAKLRAQDLAWPEEGRLKDFQEPNFLPTATGIAFSWNPYEVGNYAQGAPGVFLTRAELGDCASNLPRVD